MDIIPDGGADQIDDISGFFDNRQSVHLLRLDRLHPVVSGNKWFKLKRNLEAARAAVHSQLITFGGAYSNHLVATAAAARQAGIRAVGVVRGLHASAVLTPTLQACTAYGMKLHFVDRADYALKETPSFLEQLQQQYGRSYMIPEGGDNEAGRLGAEEIATLIPAGYTVVCVPVGTGTTLTGLRNALPAATRIIGFTAMKGGDYLIPEIRTHIRYPMDTNWQLETAWAGRGFAKTTSEQITFMRHFYAATGIPLDVVYTGKMMLGVRDGISRHAFAEGEKLLCIHTGGLQGNPPGLYGTDDPESGSAMKL